MNFSWDYRSYHRKTTSKCTIQPGHPLRTLPDRPSSNTGGIQSSKSIILPSGSFIWARCFFSTQDVNKTTKNTPCGAQGACAMWFVNNMGQNNQMITLKKGKSKVVKHVLVRLPVSNRHHMYPLNSPNLSRRPYSSIDIVGPQRTMRFNPVAGIVRDHPIIPYIHAKEEGMPAVKVHEKTVYRGVNSSGDVFKKLDTFPRSRVVSIKRVASCRSK